MPKDFSQLRIPVPKIDDAGAFLKACGTVVVDEIVAMIGREQKPDGSPQKQNAKPYREAKMKLKGYTTPLKGISKVSPYLARRATFLREIVNLSSSSEGKSIGLLIRLNQKRAEVGKKLTLKGYWFMGITRQAEYNVMQRADRYWRNVVRRMRGG